MRCFKRSVKRQKGNDGAVSPLVIFQDGDECAADSYGRAVEHMGVLGFSIIVLVSDVEAPRLKVRTIGGGGYFPPLPAISAGHPCLKIPLAVRRSPQIAGTGIHNAEGDPKA